MAQASNYWTESTTALTGSATFNGTARDAIGSGSSTGGYSQWCFFRAIAYSDQSGTLYVDHSSDGATWSAAGQASLTGGTPISLNIPTCAQWYRVRYINGATAQGTFTIRSSYSIA